MDQSLGPSKTLALRSMKVLEILSVLKISQSLETHNKGMWEGLEGAIEKSIFISKTCGSTSATLFAPLTPARPWMGHKYGHSIIRPWRGVSQVI